ncbi:hypothetical protein C2G38_2165890 [Gigaspora rosea]|uniref:Uncharacterized protein n=1 Tax=Gigaspora rosea TaxID=44941 RepID=A0A397VUM9_9GLOM|nr:hypothetical protein C2G38_2165890 [Gigaspora rosea]
MRFPFSKSLDEWTWDNVVKSTNKLFEELRGHWRSLGKQKSLNHNNNNNDN